MRINMEKILITGGGGYVGSVLVPLLLKNNYQVTVLDLMIYGSHVLKPHPNLKISKIDIRNINEVDTIISQNDTLIHLACISNDPSFELNPLLGREINLDAFEPIVKSSIKNNIKKFIFASSSSVYGIKKELNVTEEMSLEPLTDYSKYKAACEEILFKYSSDKFCTTVIRPATVCGYSPRQRLDVVVNILTNLAYHKKEITIFGGEQLRPNIHIDDMADAYLAILNSNTNLINKRIFNAGYENQKVKEIANEVKEVVGDEVKLIKVKSDDNRSYHISSEKIKNELGFTTKKTIKDAILDLKKAFDNNLLHQPLVNENYFNIKKMQSINLK
ncbi:SDR family oxidoreductase [Alphaproteobacteria bacterium]|nr:SDR family oxidoreductase [Alphaproteobacteria bacterium]